MYTKIFTKGLLKLSMFFIMFTKINKSSVVLYFLKLNINKLQ